MKNSGNAFELIQTYNETFPNILKFSGNFLHVVFLFLVESLPLMKQGEKDKECSDIWREGKILISV